MSSTELVAQPDRDPWEKQKGETAKAFHAFALHRDSGPTRTLVKTATLYGETLGPSRGVGKDRKGGEPVHVSQIQKWARQYEWHDRCEAYDLYTDRRRREQEETRREQVLAQHLFAGQLLVQASIQRLQGSKEVGKLDANRMDWGDVPRALEVGVRTQRLAMGEPTDFVKGALALTPPQVQEIVRDVIGILMVYVPEEREPAAVRDLQAYFHRGGQAPAVAA